MATRMTNYKWVASMLLVGIVVVWFAILETPTPVYAAAGTDVLGPDEWLFADQSITSADGRFTLVMQSDGNLVLYQNGVGPLWSTGTIGSGADRLVMQSDGNLVVYTPHDGPVWSSNTVGERSILRIQNDGNLVMFRESGDLVWGTNTIVCEIVVGGGGESETYSAVVNGANPVAQLSSIKAREFIRSTTGPCTFEVFNQENFGGPYVTLGTDLDDRIRAGIDGVENRDGGGGDTWRVRSIRMVRAADSRCVLRIGGNGVRMTYFTGKYSVVPAMNRVSQLSGKDPRYNGGVGCGAILHNSTDFAKNKLRFDIQFPFEDDGSPHDPGFRVRSIEVDYVP